MMSKKTTAEVFNKFLDDLSAAMKAIGNKLIELENRIEKLEAQS